MHSQDGDYISMVETEVIVGTLYIFTGNIFFLNDTGYVFSQNLQDQAVTLEITGFKP